MVKSRSDPFNSRKAPGRGSENPHIPGAGVSPD